MTEQATGAAGAEQSDWPAKATVSATPEPVAPSQMKGWLALLPPEVAALVAPLHPITDHEPGLEAAKLMTQAIARAKKDIKTLPNDRQVKYTSKRTQEKVEYQFASLAAIHEEIDEKLSEHGLTVCAPVNPLVIVIILRHVGGGMMLSWLDMQPSPDLKDTASQMTLIRRYLTVHLLCLSGEAETGDQNIDPRGRTALANRQQRQRAQGEGIPAQPRSQPRPQPRPTTARSAAAAPGPAATQGQGQRPAEPAASAAQAAAGATSTPQGRAQAQEAQRAETGNRIQAVLAQLPPETAKQLQERHKNRPADLLRAAEGTLKAQPDRRTPSNEPAPPAPAAAATSEGPQDDAAVTEERIQRGFEVLRMSAVEERAVREAYRDRSADELLEHVAKLYKEQQAQRQAPRPSETKPGD